MKGLVNVFIVMALFGVQSKKDSAPYRARWSNTMEENNNIARETDKMAIHCYPGKEKSIEMLWQTAVIRIFIQDDAFTLHVGKNPKEIYDKQDAWQHVLRPDMRRSLVVDPFSKTCIYVQTREPYSVEVFVIDVDKWRVVSMLVGILLVFSARILSRTPVFFYLLASTFGVMFLILVILYYLSRQSIIKTGILVTLFFGGWTTLMYFSQQFFDDGIFCNKYLSIAAGTISFIIAYRIGPSQNPRTKIIMMWVMQGLGGVVIISSSWHEEAAAAVFLMSLGITYLFQFLIRSCRINGTQGTNGLLGKGIQNGKEQV